MEYSPNRLKKVSGYITDKHYQEMLRLSQEKKLPMSRLVAVAIDNEFQTDKPFEWPMYPVIEGEYVEFAYAHEAGLILNFLKTQMNGMGIDLLLLLREDIGITDKEVFLAAFRECLEKGLLESYVPKAGKYAPAPAEGYYHYRIPGTGPKENKKLRNKVTKYEKYLKLKKEFEK